MGSINTVYIYNQNNGNIKRKKMKTNCKKFNPFTNFFLNRAVNCFSY